MGKVQPLHVTFSGPPVPLAVSVKLPAFPRVPLITAPEHVASVVSPLVSVNNAVLPGFRLPLAKVPTGTFWPAGHGFAVVEQRTVAEDVPVAMRASSEAKGTTRASIFMSFMSFPP
jgi:hypothetical protein